MAKPSEAIVAAAEKRWHTRLRNRGVDELRAADLLAAELLRGILDYIDEEAERRARGESK